MLIIGKEEAIDDAIKVLQGHFQVKDPTSLEYLNMSPNSASSTHARCW